ncbi:hypothetical protein [Noviherbaspirillum soli]|uniref:hypothetical protein n=1 Tax=Noviherbaspirillum soli TaxID=1064518 RepID=UPI00188A8FF0|nr:hypothetical protein [Noviherbaspirillum soli]
MDASSPSAAIQKSPADPIKWITLAVTLIGISAWMAGESFHRGFWHLAGWDGPIEPISVQQTAYDGFVRTVDSWFYVSIWFVIVGVYVFFLSAGPKKNYPAPAWLVKIVVWLKEHIHLEESTARFSGNLILSGLIFGVLIVLPLIFWVNSASNAGRDLFIKQTCEMRNGRAGRTEVQLFDGTKLQGTFLERTDKLSVILNKEFIYVVSLGEKSRILDKTTVGTIPCKNG